MGLAAVSVAKSICTKTEPRRTMTIQPTTPIQLPSSPENDHDALARCGGHVLIVDDDPAIRKMITRYFEEQDMPVVAVPGRQELNQQLGRAEPGLIVLDLRLGQEDGLDLLREIRARSDVPIIIMTGHRRDEVDRVVGLELGADDYITKPFGLRELLARVRAVLRRQDAGSRSAPDREAASGGFRFENWQLDLRTRRLLNPESAH